MKQTLSKSLLSLTVAGLLMTGGSMMVAAPAIAQEEQKASERPTRRTPALRSKVYEQLARAQEKADAGSIPEAVEILDVVQDKSSSMNSYELAMMYNFYGFIYYNDEQYDKALENFAKVVEQQPIP